MENNIIILLVLCSYSVAQQSSCSNVRRDRVSLVFLSEISDSPTCNHNPLSASTLAMNLMADFAIDRLNDLNSTNIRPSGIQYELEHMDICLNESYGVRTASTFIPKSVWTEQSYCSANVSSTRNLLIGFLGPTTSRITIPVAGFLSRLLVPVITPSATTLELSDKTRYASLHRKIATDDDQSKAIVEFLNEINIRYAMLLHSDDEYGRAGAKLIEKYAKLKGICLTTKIEVPNKQGDYVDIANQMNTDLSNATIYFGGTEGSSVLQSILARLSIRKLMVMSDGADVPSIQRLINSTWLDNQNIDLVVIQYSNPSALLDEFKTYIRKRQSAPRRVNRKTDNWLEELQKQGLNITQDLVSYGGTVLDAVLTMVDGFVKTHRRLCSDDGVCNELMNSQRFYAEMNAIVQSDQIHSDIESAFPEKTTNANDVLFNFVSIRRNAAGAVIASYKRNGHEIKVVRTEQENINVISACQTNCCESPKEDYTYVPSQSKLLIIGFGSITTKENAFECKSNIEGKSFIRMTAFYYSAQLIRSRFGIDFATLYIDTCSAKMRMNKILTDLFSNEEYIELYNKNAGSMDRIKIENIVAIIGGQSSDATIQTQQIIGGYKIPQISDGATSVWLNDRDRYPSFLRTVPSDDAQALAMIKLVKQKLNVKRIGIISTNTIYGVTGAKLVSESAAREGLCVTLEQTILSDGKNIPDVVEKMLAPDSPQVFIYFGEENPAKMLLNRTQKYKERDWKVDKKIFIGSELINDDQSFLTYGSILRGSFTFDINNDRFSLSDSSEHPKHRLQEYLRNLDRDHKDFRDNQMFLRFWQQHFRCHIPGEFSMAINLCHTNCSLIEKHQVCPWKDENVIDYKDTFAEFTIMSMLAIGTTMSNVECEKTKTECVEQSLNNPNGRQDFLKNLQDVKIPDDLNEFQYPNMKLFDQAGNGYPDYTIYNIQIEDSTGFVFKPVYKISDGSFEPAKQPLYYDSNNQVETPFDVQECFSDVCQCANGVGTDDSDSTSSKMQDVSGVDSAVIVLLALLLTIVVGALLAVIIFILCRQRKQGSERTKYPKLTLTDGGHRNRGFSDENEQHYQIPQHNRPASRVYEDADKLSDPPPSHSRLPMTSNGYNPGASNGYNPGAPLNRNRAEVQMPEAKPVPELPACGPAGPSKPIIMNDYKMSNSSNLPRSDSCMDSQSPNYLTLTAEGSEISAPRSDNEPRMDKAKANPALPPAGSSKAMNDYKLKMPKTDSLDDGHQMAEMKPDLPLPTTDTLHASGSNGLAPESTPPRTDESGETFFL